MEEKIKNDLKAAQLARDEVKTSTLRLLISEINNARIQKQTQLSDPDIISVIQKEAKKRKESIEAFKMAGRAESAAKEEAELMVLQGYLPDQISTEELTKIVDATIKEVGANSIADMGRVIGLVMGKVGQAADGGSVSILVKQKLNG